MTPTTAKPRYVEICTKFHPTAHQILKLLLLLLLSLFTAIEFSLGGSGPYIINK